MNDDAQLKLQAFLDGELPEREAAEVRDWLARDEGARLLVAELQNTGAALAGHEEGVKLPESREFFWSKISHEIERQERAATLPARPARRSWLLRLLVPAGALAAFAAIAIISGREAGLSRPIVASDAETTLADADAFTYHDEASGATLVWLSYPAESGIASQAVN